MEWPSSENLDRAQGSFPAILVGFGGEFKPGCLRVGVGIGANNAVDSNANWERCSPRGSRFPSRCDCNLESGQCDPISGRVPMNRFVLLALVVTITGCAGVRVGPPESIHRAWQEHRVHRPGSIASPPQGRCGPHPLDRRYLPIEATGTMHRVRSQSRSDPAGWWRGTVSDEAYKFGCCVKTIRMASFKTTAQSRLRPASGTRSRRISRARRDFTARR